MSFEILGSHKSSASNGARFAVETKKLWPFEDDRANNERKCHSRTPFRNCWMHFGALTGSQIMHTISRFESREVRSPMLQTVHNWELKQRSYGRLKMNHAKPKWEFRSRAPISKGVSQLRNHPLAHECHFAASYAHFAAAKIPSSTKSFPSCRNDLQASQCQQSLTTMHLKRRALSLRSHTRSLSLHY